MIIPGPKESDPDQTQRYVRILVNELLRLWRNGVVLPTYCDARGRHVRVILVGVFCDKPAAHKLGGFGSHAHTFFCTRDWITQGLKATARAFVKAGECLQPYDECITWFLSTAHAFPPSQRSWHVQTHTTAA